MQNRDGEAEQIHQQSGNALPSIRELFGIRASDNLNSLAPAHDLSQRSHNSYDSHSRERLSPYQSAAQLDPTRVSPSHNRQNAQVSGRVNESFYDRRSAHDSPPSPTSKHPFPHSNPYPNPHAASPQSAVSSQAARSPTNAVSNQALPPLSAAIPEFLSGARGRSVSDAASHSHSHASPSSSLRGPLHSPPSHSPADQSVGSAPQHPSLYPTHRDNSSPEQRRIVGRSTVQASSPSSHHPPTVRGRAYTAQGSTGNNDSNSSPQVWNQSRSSMGSSSRSSVEYPRVSPAYEYAPHPYSPASMSARHGSAPMTYPPVGHAANSGAHNAEGGFRGVENVPPSSFPHRTFSQSSRPRSAHSSEGEESRPGFGKYECEYCSKRFNRPSSLKIHINTHTGAKPFQCPFPGCGRRFSVMSNMRRHARTHGTMIVQSPDDDQSPQQHGGTRTGGSESSSNNSTGHIRESNHTDPSSRRSNDWGDQGMEVDELEDEDDVDLDDASGSEGSPTNTSPAGRSRGTNPTNRFGGFMP